MDSSGPNIRNKCLLQRIPSIGHLLDLTQSLNYYSLIAPVQPYGDVPLDLASLVLSEVALDELPTQVNELVHHMAEFVKQIHFVFLLKKPKKSQLRLYILLQ